MKYPYIGKGTESGTIALIYSKGSSLVMNSKTWAAKNGEDVEVEENYFKNITREYLSNTWGVVESKEHAEFIIELARSAGLITSDTWNNAHDYFSINYNGLLFWNGKSPAESRGEKQITIPLPPKAKAEKPDLSKLPIHFDCACNKCGGKCCIGNCDEWSEVGGDKAMNNIKWEDGAVCFAGGKQYTNVFIPSAVMAKDFQINEIRQGDYIPASELGTEQKYNDAVEVFELFGFYAYLNNGIDKDEFIENAIVKSLGLIADDDMDLVLDYDKDTDSEQRKRKLTYPQLMAIGKLKRAMIDFEKFSRSDIPQNEKRNKSKQAYEILKSLDYDYDLDKQKWFKKEYI